jgi:hypothetical protein
LYNSIMNLSSKIIVGCSWSSMSKHSVTITLPCSNISHINSNKSLIVYSAEDVLVFVCVQIFLKQLIPN